MNWWTGRAAFGLHNIELVLVGGGGAGGGVAPSASSSIATSNPRYTLKKHFVPASWRNFKLSCAMEENVEVQQQQNNLFLSSTTVPIVCYFAFKSRSASTTPAILMC